MHHTFLYVSFPFLHDYDVKMLNFGSYGERKQPTTKFYFSFWAWICCLEIQLPQHWFGTPIWPPWRHMKTFSLTWPRAIQIYWNKRKLLHKIKFQPLEDWFGTPTWPAVSLFWDTNMADVTSLENAVLFRNRFISRFLPINYSWELALVDFICYLLPLPSRKK